MKNVAVVYSNRTRQSSLVAHRIREVLFEAGVDSEAIPIGTHIDAVYEGICRFDAVIVGGPSHGLCLPFLLEEWMRHHGADLAKVPSYLFSVSETTAEDRDGLYRTYLGAVRDFVQLTGQVPQRSACFAGSNRIGIGKRLRQLLLPGETLPAALKRKNPNDQVLEWEKVTRFAQRIVSDALSDEALRLADLPGMEK